MLSTRVYAEIERLYNQQYREKFKSLLALVESLKGKFPGPILNELRAVQDHISRCFTAGISEVEALEEINKARGHLERANMDCYKALLIIYEKKLGDFEKAYDGVNLALVKDGEFLTKFQNDWDAAKDLAIGARKMESESFLDKLKAYAEFEKAVVAYQEIDNYLRECRPALIHVKVCTEIAKKSDRKKRIVENLIFAIISAVLGIILGYVL